MSTAIQSLVIEIFDPPLCCPSGLCGPTVDPALLDINEAVLKLKSEYDGKVTIERYLLSQQGQKFMQVPEVLALLKREGVSVLPLTRVNGRIIKQKAYPTYEELKMTIEEKS